jgi:hypothetical protein
MLSFFSPLKQSLKFAHQQYNKALTPIVRISHGQKIHYSCHSFYISCNIGL